MGIYSEAQFYKDILHRNLNEEQMEELEELNRLPGTNIEIIRSDATAFMTRRARQKRRQGLKPRQHRSA